MYFVVKFQMCPHTYTRRDTAHTELLQVRTPKYQDLPGGPSHRPGLSSSLGSGTGKKHLPWWQSGALLRWEEELQVERTGTFSLDQPMELEVVANFHQGLDLYFREKIKVMPPNSDPPSHSARNGGDSSLTASFWAAEMGFHLADFLGLQSIVQTSLSPLPCNPGQGFNLVSAHCLPRVDFCLPWETTRATVDLGGAPRRMVEWRKLSGFPTCTITWKGFFVLIN